MYLIFTTDWYSWGSTQTAVRACSTRQEGNSTTSQRRRQTSWNLARVGIVMRAGHQQGGGVGGCSSGVVWENNIAGSEFSECRRARILFEYPLRKQLLKEYFSPTSPLLVLSTHKKRIYKTDMSMKVHFKTTKGRGLRITSRTNLRRYIVYHPRLSTLAANDKPQNCSIQNICI